MIFEKVAGLLAEQLDVSMDDLSADTRIVDDLGADSIDVVDMLMTLEDEFNIQIPDEQIESLKTIGDVVDYIQNNAE